MTLAEFLRDNKLTLSAFADLVAKHAEKRPTEAMVARWRDKAGVPSRRYMSGVIAASDGEVDIASFYDLEPAE